MESKIDISGITDKMIAAHDWAIEYDDCRIVFQSMPREYKAEIVALEQAEEKARQAEIDFYNEHTKVPAVIRGTFRAASTISREHSWDSEENKRRYWELNALTIAAEKAYSDHWLKRAIDSGWVKVYDEFVGGYVLKRDGYKAEVFVD